MSGGTRVEKPVGPGSAADRIGPRSAIDPVIAVAAKQKVGFQPAPHRVVAGLTIDVINPAAAKNPVGSESPQNPVVAVAANGRIAAAACADPVGGISPDAATDNPVVAGGTPQGIDPVAAKDRVVARTAVQNVIACPADQAVVAVQPAQRIGPIAAVQQVIPIPTLLQIRPDAAKQTVIAIRPEQLVIARAAVKPVAKSGTSHRIAKSRTGHGLDAHKRIARRPARVRRRPGQVDHDGCRGQCIINPVRPRSAVHHVGPGTAVQNVTAPQSMHRVVTRGSVHHVGMIRPFDALRAKAEHVEPLHPGVAQCPCQPQLGTFVARCRQQRGQPRSAGAIADHGRRATQPAKAALQIARRPTDALITIDHVKGPAAPVEKLHLERVGQRCVAPVESDMVPGDRHAILHGVDIQPDPTAFGPFAIQPCVHIAVEDRKKRVRDRGGGADHARNRPAKADQPIGRNVKVAASVMHPTNVEARTEHR